MCRFTGVRSSVQSTHFRVRSYKLGKKKEITTFCVYFLITALFAAVEHGYVEKAKTILESSDVDVNRCGFVFRVPTYYLVSHPVISR